MNPEACNLRIDLQPGCYFIADPRSIGIDIAMARLLIDGLAPAGVAEESDFLLRQAASRLSMIGCFSC